MQTVISTKTPVIRIETPVIRIQTPVIPSEARDPGSCLRHPVPPLANT